MRGWDDLKIYKNTFTTVILSGAKDPSIRHDLVQTLMISLILTSRLRDPSSN